MRIFGKRGDPQLRLGRVFTRDRYGMTVQEGRDTVYLRHDLTSVQTGYFGSPGVWNRWLRTFMQPSAPAAPPPAPAAAVVLPRPRPVRKFPPLRGPSPAAPSVLFSLLTIKVDGVVVLQGTEAAGIGIKVDGVEKMPEGGGVVLVKVDGV